MYSRKIGAIVLVSHPIKAGTFQHEDGSSSVPSQHEDGSRIVTVSSYPDEMDKLSFHQRKDTRSQAISKKKPIKVVHISNPMKVKTSASEFRALVQKLTGRDSKFFETDGFQTVPDRGMKLADGDHVQEVPMLNPCHKLPSKCSDDSFFEQFDDHVFAPPHMLENFTEFLSSNLSYESPQMDVFRSHGAI
ncbi:hypothetical protein HHK36_011758 [Tetracentron sinense]|uniref:VQ domain-containing protein n=1 Tax=Tetracentron sinense TaxID=13715 RepID=A0A835DKQ7_TETSI|nr:hypothetical protein HHK36_011758 [Tetracentron sinense]